MNNQSTRRILLVDDDEALSSALHERLTSDGYEVSMVGDGKAGLETALTEHPDLIILDVMMPIMDGWETLEALRADGWGMDAKVIMLTNADDMENVARAVSHQAQEYLIKGTWTLDDISAKVKDLLG